jgi:AcrR family transcriptional regulator
MAHLGIDGRGRYDRTATASERARKARSAIISAVVHMMCSTGERPSVEEICAATGLGRNTFYGHFNSARAAADEVVGERLANIAATLEALTPSATTPYAELQQLADGWFRYCEAESESVLVVRASAPGRLLELLGARLSSLHAAGASSGVYRRTLESERRVALTGATLELSAAVAARRIEAAGAATAFVDAVLGLCR